MDGLKPEIEVGTEREDAHGWRYTVTADHDGARREFDVRLDWSDHDYWTGGACPPSRTVHAMVAALIEHEDDLTAPLPRRFDASTARRLLASLDDEVRARI